MWSQILSNTVIVFSLHLHIFIIVLRLVVIAPYATHTEDIFINFMASLYQEEGSVKKRSAEEYFTAHEVVRPRVYNKHGEQIYSTLTQKSHIEEITISVPVDNQLLTLDLHLNKRLFPGSYIEKYYTADGENLNVHHSNKSRLHCYYQGSARGHHGSTVAVSTCDGIRATVYLDADTLHLEPQSTTIDGEHLLFRDSNQIPTNHKCGVHITGQKERYEHSPLHQRLKRDIRWPANSNTETKVVELYVVNDYEQYRTYDYNTDKVIKRTKDIVNAASALYKSLDIHIALVGIEVWTEADQISISEDAELTMTNFLEYRRNEISPHHKNDNAQLLTDQRFRDDVIGKAPIDTMCSWQYSGGVNMDHHVLVGPVATTIAHEMGHNFGLQHDAADCTCPEARCIMNRNSGGNQPKHWSSCSQEQFEDAFHQGMDYCLHDLPGDGIFQGPVCGNGFMEDGEQCDCGTPDACESKCCDAATCRLFPNATCATGACCNLNTCKLKEKTTLCRAKADQCDLEEYCHGNSEFCPSDAYRQDGTSCKVSGQASYCYEGRCRNRESQCQLLWGDTGHTAADICFTNYNLQGIANGNCGFHWVDRSFDACTPEDVFCGMLHCRHLAEKLMFWKEPLSYTMPTAKIPDENGVVQMCYGAILDVGLDYQDPGMVPNGAKCGDKKICVDAKCTALSQIPIKGCPDCHDKGVCNNLGQCHCDVGWAPPRCDKVGDGGSLHSGPIKIYKSGSSNWALFVGLVVLFIFVLPILGAFLLIGYRHRDEIKKIWVANTRKDKYRTICRAKPSNAGDHTTTTTTTTSTTVTVANTTPTSSATAPIVKKVPPPKPKAAPKAAPVARAKSQIYKPRPVKRASSFSPHDIGEFKFESTTNKHLDNMTELPVRYRSPTLDAARSNRPLSYPSSSNHGDEEDEEPYSQDGGVGGPRPQPTRPAPRPPGNPPNVTVNPLGNHRLPTITRNVPLPPLRRPNVGAHGSTNVTQQQQKPKPERPPQLPDISKLHHGSNTSTNVPSYRTNNTEPVVQVNTTMAQYQNVPSTHASVDSDLSNHSDYPHYENAETPSNTVLNMRNKFESPNVSVSDVTIVDKRPVPQARSVHTGQNERSKQPKPLSKPELPAPLQRSNQANARAGKPPVLQKPNFLRSGDSRA